jgi:hypothetical protein
VSRICSPNQHRPSLACKAEYFREYPANLHCQLRRQLWVMNDKTQNEHNESALPLKADVRATSVDFAYGHNCGNELNAANVSVSQNVILH